MPRLADLLRGNRMKDPVRGRAQVVACSAHNGRDKWGNCRMQLVIEAEGVPAASLAHAELTHWSRWPSAGDTLPVTIDRANPDRVRIDWAEVPDAREHGARLRDPGDAPPASVAARAPDPVDEQLGRLERLGMLRDQGVLTPEEFEEQKRRILGA